MRSNDSKIGELLKKYRKMNGYSVADVVEKLNEKSIEIKEKTFYGWENNRSCPSIEVFLEICEIYKITNIVEAFGYDGGKAFAVTEHEKELIKKYRECGVVKPAIDKLLDLEKGDSL